LCEVELARRKDKRHVDPAQLNSSVKKVKSREKFKKVKREIQESEESREKFKKVKREERNFSVVFDVLIPR